MVLVLNKALFDLFFSGSTNLAYKARVDICSAATIFSCTTTPPLLPPL